MLPQLAFGWLTKNSEDTFAATTDKGIQGMTGNPNFPTLAAAVTAAETAYGVYLTAKANAVQGGVEATAIRDARRAELVDLLRPLLSNANAIANGDIEMLMSSGFPLRKTDRTPIGPLPAPEAPVLSQGPLSGVLKGVSPPLYGAVAYTAQLALASAPNTVLLTKQQTGTRFLWENLIPGEAYNMKMNAIGAAGTSDWSDDGTYRVI